MTSKIRHLGEHHRRFRTTGRALLGAWAVIVLAAMPAKAQRNDGLIVFESDRGGQSDLWTMESDGSNQKRLTNDRADDVFPAWSPNGKQIAWTRGGRGPEGEIWIMNADGSGQKQVTSNSFSDFNASWSPDGSEIVFRSLRGVNRDIYVIGVDGTGERRLTEDPGSDYAPDWSPDGSRIAFSSNRTGHNAVFTMDPYGNDVRQITADSQEAGIAGWSPDGTRLVYSDALCATCTESDLFVVNADGTGVTQITDSAENELGKSWSRDGSRIVLDFAPLTPSGKHLAKGDVAVTDVRTGVTVNLTNTTGINEGSPDWSTGGRPPAAAAMGGPRASSTGAAGALRVWATPGRDQSVVNYTLPKSGHIRLRIFDVRGRAVACLADGWQSEGTHAAALPRDRQGSQIYLYRLEWVGGTSSGKVVAVK